MNVDLGFSINNFAAPKGKQNPLGQQNAQTSGQNGQDFKSHLKGEKNGGQVETQSFSSKPMPDAGFGDPGPQMSSFGSSGWTANELVPKTTSSPLQEMASANVDGLTRRVAWQKFLQNMKSELNVSAEELMFAFQSLTPEELAQPPEKNIDKLVETLGLEPAQSQLAAQMFSELIARTGNRPIGQELTNSKREINLSLMSQRDQEQRKLNETLTQMSQKFFMKDENAEQKNSNKEGAVLAGGVAQSSKGAAASSSGVAIPKEFTLTEAAPLNAQSAFQVPTAKAPMTDAVSNSNSKSIDFSEVAPELAAEGEAEATTANATAAASSATVANAAPSTAPTAAAPFMTGLWSKDNNASDASQEESSTQSEAKIVKAESTNPVSELRELGKELSKEGSNSKDMMSQSQVNPGMVGTEQAKGSQFGELLAPTLAESVADAPTMSTEDLLQKAQVMVRDGGGEVKVILQPEGLGEVAMKISVQGDKVNVEMITESDAAKKLLEKGMGDLKSHLLASQLNLESIKVDTASNLGQQLEQQYQDAQRNQAQQFMEQFRQSNQEFRRGFNELPGAKMYKGQTQGQATPEVNATSDRSKGGRRLNLVA